MGLSIKDIVPRKELEFKSLKDKIIAVDAFNALYQFLSSIRQYDGTPLQDKSGKVTSHLSGLLYRNMALLSEGVKIIYVFDGEAPELKAGTQAKRLEGKKIAKEKYEAAKAEDDVVGMKKYSSATVHLTDDLIKESKEFLEAMGIAVVQAPSEGEAEASVIAKNGGAYAVGSQDYDCLLFGAPRLIQNLTLARKRKTPGGYVEIKPEIIELADVLKELEIDHDQLICLGILVGTDYNPSGIKGLGQKKALKFVKEFKTPEKIFAEFDDLEFDWKEIFEMFKNPEVLAEVEIEFPEIDVGRMKEILIGHDFLEDRVDKQIEKLKLIKGLGAQKTLF